MFMHIVTQISGRLTALFTAAFTLIKAQLLPLVNRLRVSTTQAYQSVANLRLLVALTEQSTSLWRVNLITVVLLIKAGLINVQAKVLQIGSQLQTTVAQISLLVRQALLQIKDKLVECIKLVRLRLNAIGCALTLMARRLTQTGTKSAEAVKPLRRRAKQASKRGK